MTIFAVSYDLINEDSGHDYQPLWDEFARLKAHKTQYSMYLINLSNTAKEVVDHFKAFTDKDDRLWAIEVAKGKYHYVNAMKGTNAWLEKNPPL
jgi:hypothetical protein